MVFYLFHILFYNRFLFSLSINTEKPDLSDSISNIQIEEGNPIELPCQANSYTEVTIWWEKKGSPGTLAKKTSK